MKTKRKPSKLDQCIKKRGLGNWTFVAKKGEKRRGNKQLGRGADLLGLEEWKS